jgi:hypothetical protein
MVKIKIIALLLSLLMTLQMLPISQIGQMLSSNQWVEELPHDSNDSEDKAEGAILSNFFPQLVVCNIVYLAQSKELAYLHLSDQIPSNHSSDVLTEPPNLLF